MWEVLSHKLISKYPKVRANSLSQKSPQITKHQSFTNEVTNFVLNELIMSAIKQVLVYLQSQIGSLPTRDNPT